MNSVCFYLLFVFTSTVQKIALMLLVTETSFLSFIHRQKARGSVHSYMMYSNSEYADMHLVHGAADGNALESRRRYSELFPRRHYEIIKRLYPWTDICGSMVFVLGDHLRMQCTLRNMFWTWYTEIEPPVLDKLVQL